MKPPELIELLKTLDQEKEIFCQVVATNRSAWNMDFNFHKSKEGFDFNILRISHPDLTSLPSWPS